MSAMNYGDIAQLGERLNRIQEVSGSIPLISTKSSFAGINYGGIAQLGEHLLCKQGVSGSIPLTSTIFYLLAS